MDTTLAQNAPRTIKKVVLVEPKSTDIHIFNRFAMPRLGVVLLGTILRDAGYDVKVLVEEAKTIDMGTLFSADLVGISAITPTASRSYFLADQVRAAGIPVVLGGPHPTHCAEESLEHADYVVRGEAEVALPALVRAIVAGTGFDSVPNLTYRDGEETKNNPLAKSERDLDRHPDPDHSLVESTGSSIFLGHKRIIPIQTSRGCPYDCSFCTVTSTFGRKMRFRSVERVLSEMASFDLEKTHFFIYDDNFAANRRRTREMLAGFRSLPVTPTWSAQVRADVAKDEALLDEMRASGCDLFYVGLESVNQQSLTSAQKRQELDDVRCHLRRIRARDIAIHGMFVMGFDTDDEGTMERTVAFAREHDLFSVQFLILTPLPGSRWAQELEQSGRVLHHDWSQYDTHHVVFQPALVSPAELQRWQVDGHGQFYSVRRIIESVMIGHLPRALVTFYALCQNQKWKKNNTAYMAALDGQRSKGLLDRFKAALPALPTTATSAATAK